MAIKSLLLAASAMVAVSADPEMRTRGSGPGFMTRFNGNSGGFKIFLMHDNATRGDFWNIRYLKLYEIDASGNAVGHGNTRVYQPSFTLTAGQSLQNQPTAWVDGSAGVVSSGSPSLTMRNALFTSASTVILPDNTTMPVIANSLKISLNMTWYPFTQPTNRLALDIKISSSKPDGTEGDDGPKRGDPRPDHHGRPRAGADMSGGPDVPGIKAAFDFETFSFADDSTQSSEVVITQKGNIYTLTFASFANHVWYDPTLAVTSTSDSNGAAGSFLAIGATLAAACATWVAGQAVWNNRDE